MSDCRKLSFTIPGPPKAKGRPRVTTAGGFARTFTDAATRTYESTVATAAAAAMEAAGLDLLDGNLSVEVVAVFTRPKRLCRKSDPDGLIFNTSKPDLDNVVKSVLDGMAPVWRDDSAVVRILAHKYYAERSGAPRCVVHVTTLSGLGGVEKQAEFDVEHALDERDSETSLKEGYRARADELEAARLWVMEGLRSSSVRAGEPTDAEMEAAGAVDSHPLTAGEVNELRRALETLREARSHG